MKKRSLGFKLIVGGTLAVLLPLLLVGYSAVSKTSKALQVAYQGQAANISDDIAHTVDLYFDEQLSVAKGLASLTEFRNAAAQTSLDADEEAVINSRIHQIAAGFGG